MTERVLSQHDKQKSAIALQYNDSEQTAPEIVAKGNGDIASEIISLAAEHGILVHEDPQLLVVLNQFDIGDQVPEELYLVVAELIAFSYVLQGRYPEGWKGHKNLKTSA